MHELTMTDGQIDRPAMWLWTTVILLVVSVPVLSEQIAVALPIVSQASRCRTRLLSCIIFYNSDIRYSSYELHLRFV